MDTTAKTNAITTNVMELLYAALFKIKNFAIKPAVNGIPPREIKAILKTMAKKGFSEYKFSAALI